MGALGPGPLGPTGPPLGVAQAAISAASESPASAFRLGARAGAADDGVRTVMSRPSTDPNMRRDPREGRAGSPPLEAGLYVVATPIGNLRDITLRALDVLAGADLVFAEDTRVTRKLLDAYGLAPKLASYHEHNAERAREVALAALARGERVALVSDAGTPLVSDPGFKLVRAALDAGHRVIPIPGASASLAALVAAGLPTDQFFFAGFAPAKAGARARFFAPLIDVPATLVFYETGPRLADSLAAMAEVFGDRNAAVARELTKHFEEVQRGPLSALAARYAEAAPKGEIVVIVDGAPPPEAPGEDELDAALREALTRLSVREAASEIAQRFNIARKLAYARALVLQDE